MERVPDSDHVEDVSGVSSHRHATATTMGPAQRKDSMHNLACNKHFHYAGIGLLGLIRCERTDCLR